MNGYNNKVTGGLTALQ